MIAKLTLTIDKQVVDKAKIYAKKKNRSVSKLVEEYLRTISSTDAATSSIPASKADITDKIIQGCSKKSIKGKSIRIFLKTHCWKTIYDQESICGFGYHS